MTTKESGLCSMCQELYMNWGNNPQPLKDVDERCCNRCDKLFVLPARLGVKFDPNGLLPLARALAPYTHEQLLSWLGLASWALDQNALGQNEITIVFPALRGAR